MTHVVHNTFMRGFFEENPTRQAAVHGLAVVGFLALLLTGMALAVYTARFVPVALSQVASAAVYFSSLFVPATTTPSLEVVAGDTIPFENGSANATTTEPTTPATPPVKPASKPATPSAGTRTDTSYQISGGAPSPTLSGLSDLAPSITAVGYLTGTSTDSFIATTTIPAHSRIGVKFSITNKGTNKTGDWRFNVSIPTELSYLFESPVQQSLNPGDHIEYVLGFDQARAGVNQSISVLADFDKKVDESDEKNNGANASVTVLGS